MPYHTGSMNDFISIIPTSERIKYFDICINQLYNTLCCMYNHNILHRDIKPENILMEYNYNTNTGILTNSPICYLADFGLGYQQSCIINEYDVIYTDVLFWILQTS